MEHNARRYGLPRFLTWPGWRFRRSCHAALSFLTCTFFIFVLAAVSPALAASAANTAHFVLTSPTVRSGATMPPADVGTRNGCPGDNQSPPLIWNDGPAGTGSYAVSMADLDAKVGVTWLWMMFNLPATVTSLAQNAARDPKLRPPGAVQARNGFGGTSYTGPCPRKGKFAHHYLITVWALKDTTLPFKEGTPADRVAIYLRGHAIGHASLTPHYARR